MTKVRSGPSGPIIHGAPGRSWRNLATADVNLVTTGLTELVAVAVSMVAGNTYDIEASGYATSSTDGNTAPTIEGSVDNGATWATLFAFTGNRTFSTAVGLRVPVGVQNPSYVAAANFNKIRFSGQWSGNPSSPASFNVNAIRISEYTP